MTGVSLVLPIAVQSRDSRAAESLFSLLQLSDSAFPSGRYTLSHGLETLVQSGQITPSSGVWTLTTLLANTIRLGVAPADGRALALAHSAIHPGGVVDLDRITQVDLRLTAVKLVREVREASVRTGRALMATASIAIGPSQLDTYAERVRDGRTPGNHAVVIGILSAALDVPRSQAIIGELYAFCSGWTAAAVRLRLVNHRTAQVVLHRIRGVIAEAAFDAADGDITRIASCTPMLDLMSMRHEDAELRLFAT